MAQIIYPSVHTYELFKPYESNETMMAEVLPRIAELGVYRGVETGFFFEPANISLVRNTCAEQHWSLTMWATPALLAEHLNLSSLDEELRERSVQRTIELLNYAIECGATKIGLPSGDYPGDARCAEAKTLLADSLLRICAVLDPYPDMHIVLEPLDRYAYKKQLIGPMPETVEWFGQLRQHCSNIFIHWDSAHELLGGIDLIESLDLAAPYLEQIHLCNAVTDPGHPLFGDLHMDMGQAPDFASPGRMSPDVGASILKRLASFDPTPGVSATYVAVEMRSHPGNDVWAKERVARAYLMHCAELAGISLGA